MPGWPEEAAAREFAFAGDTELLKILLKLIMGPGYRCRLERQRGLGPS